MMKNLLEINSSSAVPSKLIIREYTQEDCPELIKIFYGTVHTINAKDYNSRQLEVWAPENIDAAVWDRSFSEHFTIVAFLNDKAVGFGDLDCTTGYLDRLYVHKDFQKRGAATAMCDILEQKCTLSKIFTHASITALPFFEHRGYKIIKMQQLDRSGVLLTNYIMEKILR